MLVLEEPPIARGSCDNKASLREAGLDNVGGIEGRSDVGERTAATQQGEHIEDGRRNLGPGGDRPVLAGPKTRRTFGPGCVGRV
jgi:hypothetical protein